MVAYVKQIPLIVSFFLLRFLLGSPSFVLLGFRLEMEEQEKKRREGTYHEPYHDPSGL
jgi:hypothetical protein